MVKKRIIKKLLKYRNLLEKEGIPVTLLLLFGSHARGSASPDSDIDVCVVSPIFGDDRIKEGKRLHLLAMQIDASIEPVLFSANQYRHDKISPLLHEIKKEGIKIS